MNFPSNKRLIASIAALLAIALIASGCGSSGGDTGTAGDATAPSSKSEFIKSADAVCAGGEKQAETEYAAYLKKNNISKATESKETEAKIEARAVEVIETIAIPLYKQQAKELRALIPPEGDEKTVAAYLDAVDEGIEKAAEEPQAVFTGTSTAFDQAGKLAQEYGFKVCGSKTSG